MPLYLVLPWINLRKLVTYPAPPRTFWGTKSSLRTL